MKTYSGSARFELRRSLGSGAFGHVYEAWDRTLGRLVALKVLREAEPGRLYRFKQEFRALSQVTHPGLVSLYELLAEGDAWLFTMEKIEGVNFLSWVMTSSPPPSADISTPADEGGAPWVAGSAPSASPPPAQVSGATPCDLGRLRAALVQLTHAIMALHAAGWLHRDLKPSNVLVTHNGRVVVLDFGLVVEVRPVGAEATQDLVGTPWYMAPEQAAGNKAGRASDFYSIGVMMYEALTGQLPFGGDPKQALVSKQWMDPTHPGKWVTGVPAELASLCLELLSREPERRPTGEEILRRLGARPGAPSPSAARARAGEAPRAPFVGRERELARLHDAWARVSEGHGVVFHISGLSGVGKSALVEHFLADLRARERDVVVLAGRCFVGEQLPFKAVDSLIDSISVYLRRLPPAEVQALLPVHLFALTQVFPVLGRVEAIAGARRRVQEIPDRQELLRRAFGALREFLTRLAAGRPLVLFIDDLQWGDADSALLLSETFRSPERPPLLLLTSLRAEDAQTAPLPRALREPSAEQQDPPLTLELGPLPPHESQRLASLLLELPPELPSELPSTIAGEAAGNPFLIDAMVKYARSSAEATHTLTRRTRAPMSLTDLLGLRLAELTPDARRLLDLVAVASRPVARSVLRAALDLDDDHAALSALRRGHWIRETGSEKIETWHDKVRETLLALLAPEEQRRQHALLAAALEKRGADAETLCFHLRGAGERRRAADQAARGAEQASQALAFDQASALWRLALDLRGDEGGATRQWRQELAGALANAGRGYDAAMYFLEAARESPGEEALRLRQLAADQMLRSGHLDEGGRILRVILEKVGVGWPSHPVGAVLRGVPLLLTLLVTGPRLRREAPPLPEKARAQLEACWSAAAGLFNVDLTRGWYFHLRHLTLALRSGDAGQAALGLSLHALAEEAISRPLLRQDTQRLLDAAEGLAREDGKPHTLAFYTLSAGMVAFQRGMWRLARESCEQAEEILRSRCTGVSRELSNAVRLICANLLMLGELKELARRAPEVIEEARERGDLYSATSLATMPPANLSLLARGRPDEARHQIDDAIRRWTHTSLHLQHAWALLSRCEVDLYEGEAERAWASLEEWTPRLSSALVLQYQNVRLDLLFVRGRIALCLARREGDARRRARWLTYAREQASRLARGRRPWTRPLGGILSAGADGIEGAQAAAMDQLAQVEIELLAQEMPLHATCVRLHRLALASAPDEEVHPAAEGLRQMGVSDPWRFSAMLLGGGAQPSR